MAVIGEGNALKSCKMKSLSHEEMAGIRQAILVLPSLQYTDYWKTDTRELGAWWKNWIGCLEMKIDGRIHVSYVQQL